MNNSKAQPEVFQMLLENGIVISGIAPKLVVIPDTIPLSERLYHFLPIFLTIQLFSFLIRGSKELWQVILGKYPKAPIVKLFKVIAFLLGQIELFINSLIARAKARKPPKARLQVVRWLIQPGDVFGSNTPILEFRFSSLIPYRYVDVHQYYPDKGGVLVKTLVKPNRTARRKFCALIPIEAYELLAEAYIIKNQMLLPPKTIGVAIANYKAELQHLEQDASLTEADRRILKAQLLSHINRALSTGS
jgi:hypothetical protein